jgi:fatty acid-binding protein DegV
LFRKESRFLALLDTLKYALKGGRIWKFASAIPVIESLLPVKLLLTVDNGEIRPAGLVWSRKKGIERLRELIGSALQIEDIAIVHSTTPKDAQTLAEYASSLFPHIVPRIVRLGAALGLHCGPGTLITVLREAR